MVIKKRRFPQSGGRTRTAGSRVAERDAALGAAVDASATSHAVTDAEMEKSEQLPPVPQQVARSPARRRRMTPTGG